MPIPKSHHIVPQLILRNFTDPDGRLWYADRRFRDRTVRVGRPETVLCENHINTQVEADGSKNTVVETTLAAVEAEAAPIVEKFLTAARAGRRPALTPNEKVTWDLFVHLQWKRSPDAQKANLRAYDPQERIRETIARLEEELGPVNDEVRDWLNNPREMQRVIRRTSPECTQIEGADHRRNHSAGEELRDC